MGYSMYASTIIGFEISTKNWYEDYSEASCSHEHDSKYCPECGKPKKTYQNKRLKPEFKAQWEQFWWSEGEDGIKMGLCNYTTSIWQLEELYDGQGNKFWFGYGKKISDEEAEMAPLKSYDEIKAGILKILQPFIDTGFIVLDESKFGIWTIHAAH